MWLLHLIISRVSSQVLKVELTFRTCASIRYNVVYTLGTAT